MHDPKVRKEAIMVSLVYLLLLIITIWVPVINLLSLLILPIPFIVFSSRYGWRPASIILMIVLVIGTIISLFTALPLVVLTGLTGILIGSAIYQKLTPYETWARASLGFVIGITFIFVYVQLVFNINIIDELNQTMDESLKMTEEVLRPFGIEYGSEQLALIKQQMVLMLDLLPVAFVTIAIIFGIVIQWMGYKVLNRLDKLSLRFPPFRDFQLPKILIWIYFFAMIFTWFNIDPNSVFYLAVINVYYLAGLIISLQGLSFIFYYTYKKKLSKAIPVISILIIVFFAPIGLYMIRILGIIDLGFSLRERMTNNKK